MINTKLNYLYDQIKSLKPEQRKELDDMMLGLMVDDAGKQRRQYQLELASDYVEKAQYQIKHWGEMQGMSSGYRSIDQLTKGFVGGEVTVIGGATSNGKTALAVNITAKIAKAGISVLFVTLEMSKTSLTARLLFADPEVEDNAALIVYQKADELDWKSVDGLIENAVREMGVQFVVIDHLHYFTRELQNVSEDLGRVTKEFKKNAIRHDIPIILISHTRKTEKGKPATEADLRGSSFIGQDADIVLMVSRDEQYPDKIRVKLEKNRERGHDLKDDDRFLNFENTRISEELAVASMLGVRYDA